MGIFDFFRNMFSDINESAGDVFGWGQGDDGDEGMTSSLGDIGTDFSEISDYIDYLDDDQSGEKVNFWFEDFNAALDYVKDAPLGILKIALFENGEIEVYRYDTQPT